MPTPTALRRALVAVVGVIILARPGAALAHTEFDYSLPTGGASVGIPIDEVTVAFTLPVALVGNGFEVRDPQGNVLEPFAVTDDDRVFRLQFDPPLAGGTVAVEFEVRADDGHVLTGGFSFVVDASPPTTAAPTTAAPTTLPSSTLPPTTIAPVTEAPTTTAVVTTVDPAAPADLPADDSGSSVIILIAIAASLGAVGFLLVRSRTSG